MSLLVVGSLAFDSVETPFGEAEEVIGGSAFFFSTSASYFTDVGLVGVVGDDFPDEAVAFLKQRGIDLEGLERRAGETFRWRGRYGYDLKEPETLETELNVFGDFEPDLSESYRDSDIVFLANIDPEIQLNVLDQVDSPDFVALDTMSYWIDGKPEPLERAISRVDMVVIDEVEARKLADEPNIVRAAGYVEGLGPDYVVIKRGEYGALLFSGESIFFAPGFPLEEVNDPTGAGDTFAGGLLGYLDRVDNAEQQSTLRQSTVLGCVMASYCVEDFSFYGLRELDRSAISERCEQFYRLVDFEPVAPLED